ncbi:UNVERIFIED_CONTAM: hypothetical protein FKN15_017382 [Acipenser sinensis]
MSGVAARCSKKVSVPQLKVTAPQSYTEGCFVYIEEERLLCRITTMEPFNCNTVYNQDCSNDPESSGLWEQQHCYIAWVM